MFMNTLSRLVLSLLLPAFFLHTATTLFAQNSFQKVYAATGITTNSGQYVLPVADSGYVVVGTAQVPGPFTPLNSYIARIDKDGNVLWWKFYAPLYNDIIFRSVIEANDGGFLAFGFVRSGISTGSERAYVFKTDAAGNFQWSKALVFNGNAICNTVRSVPGGYLVAGWQDAYTIGGYLDACFIKIDNNGNILWSRTYGSLQKSAGFSDFIVESDTIYAIGGVGGTAFLGAFDLNSGEPYMIKKYTNPQDSSVPWNFIRPTSDGQLLVTGNIGTVLATGIITKMGVHKIGKDGTVILSKMLSMNNEGIGVGHPEKTSDGSFIMSGSVGVSGQTRAALVKIDANVNIEMAWRYNTLGPQSNFRKSFESPEGGFVGVGFFGNNRMLLTKTLPDGRVEGCCTAPLSILKQDFSLTAADLTDLQNGDFPKATEAFDALTEERPFTVADHCPYQPELLFNTLTFCPGDTLLIGGTAYTQPATVVDTIRPIFDCDTIVTYTLEFVTPPQPSNLNILCPSDITVEVPAGVASAVVTYNNPTASSDCLCGDVAVNMTQGLPSGANFPAGVTQVCHRASDDCGESLSCCFTVRVEQKPADNEACDVKNTPCLKFEILGIFQNPAKQKTYRMRVTNNCSNPLTYTAFQLPNGLVADAPANGSVFAAPSGRTYEVRNPNASPSHSIRFKTIGNGIANGLSDVFEYTLPPQADPTFIHVVARLEPQVFYEAHLNVFDCPVQQASNKSADERSAMEGRVRQLLLFPNPAADLLHIDLSAWSGQQVRLQVFDAMGRLALEKMANSGGEIFQLDISGIGSNGFYSIAIIAESGERQMGKFVRAAF